MSESGRRPLRPLSPQLPEPVRIFTEQLRGIYWDRTELNQRELAAALHLTKSPVSRYLNGQEVIPAPAFDDFCGIVGLAPRERQRLGRLREKAAEAAERGDIAGGDGDRGRDVGGEGGAQRVESPAPAGPRRWTASLTGTANPRRLLALSAAAVALLAAAGVGIATALDGPDGDGRSPLAASSSPATGPSCTTTRVYRVIADGDILDGDRNDIGDVRKDDLFSLDKAPAASPYRFRDYGHVVDAGVRGYVDQAKLKPVGRRCVKQAGRNDVRTEGGNTPRRPPRSSSPAS
ncbi:helix-turn-helix domain-containing protein [Streptomyces albidus (ex Kaewkla and Franco 2022)]|uniref:helix-turn-helix domain-containing protein n=1 Tax=Streptomyces albidus (ex Kaewkla and Franco 2022) TaxID=722709 RepID=UPI0015EF1D93|nr:helix-turn-helix domain-containing protein [Streptomyces albidus (ex Kaewkla and Franco 2022)]